MGWLGGLGGFGGLVGCGLGVGWVVGSLGAWVVGCLGGWVFGKKGEGSQSMGSFHTSIENLVQPNIQK